MSVEIFTRQVTVAASDWVELFLGLPARPNGTLWLASIKSEVTDPLPHNVRACLQIRRADPSPPADNVSLTQWPINANIASHTLIPATAHATGQQTETWFGPVSIPPNQFPAIQFVVQNNTATAFTVILEAVYEWEMTTGG